MLVFKYTKIDGAEFFSHLDLLKHFCKIMRRGGIDITESKGFNPHMHVYMNAPMGVGIKSLCEYCFVDSNEPASVFMQKFNEHTVRGVTCLSAVDVAKKVSVAGIITEALYKISGLNKFDVAEVLNAENFMLTDKNGVDKDLKARIKNMYFEGDELIARLGFGNETLRADAFSNKLCKVYGGEVKEIIKTQVFSGGIDFDEYLLEL